MNNEHKEPADIHVSKKKKNPIGKIILIAAIALILVGLGIYFWKEFEIKDLKTNYEARESSIVEDANTLLDENDRALLSTMVKPLSWAIRTEMLKGNYDQVNDYITQFVREDRINLVTVVSPKDSILLATDAKMVGQTTGRFLPKNLSNVNQTTIEKLNDNELIIASPVMGYNERLATLIFTYKPKKFRDNNAALKE